MFIEIDELRSAIYTYQLNEITESDNAICLMAIDAAIEEIKSYLRGQYDVKKIFNTTGTDRNALIMEICKDIAVWRLIRLSNVDIIYEHIEKRYDTAVSWLKQVAKGDAAPDLPVITDPEGKPVTKIKFGSHPKFDSSF